MAQNTDDLFRIKTIVIDAGHGGKDPGNLGTGRYAAREKNIALDVVLKLGGYIKEQFPEIKVIYTRDKDVFIGLNERAIIANKAKADLFISVHCNAFSKEASSGVETFVLGLHRNEENLQVAKTENSAIFLEDDYKTKYEGFDPNSVESIIALTMMQSAFLQQSLSFSSYIQTQFKERVGRKDRGVKQAGFLVLRKTTMPSVLIELGFLTNTKEEDFLNSEQGKVYMASAIFRGFKDYKKLVEDSPEGVSEMPKETAEEKRKVEEAIEREKKAAREKAEIDSLNLIRKQKEELRLRQEKERRAKELEESKKQAELKQKQLEIAKNKEKQDQNKALIVEAELQKHLPDPVDEKVALHADKQAEAQSELLELQCQKKELEKRIALLTQQESGSASTGSVTHEVITSKSDEKQGVLEEDGVVFRVQIASSSTPLPDDSDKFKGQKTWNYQHQGLYKYAVGKSNHFEEIVKLQRKLRSLGFEGAFVVAFKDGSRITISEAKKILEK
ncbi:N-acetylmuramoyl-L-alanine amidase [Bacteroidota bacterium]